MLRPGFVSLFSVLIASMPVAAQPTKTGKEFAINEGARPDSVWRAYGGRCGRHNYLIKINPGRFDKDSIRELSVDGRTARLVSARLRELVTKKLDLVDAVINKCESGRALIRFDVADRKNGYQLNSYFIWVTTGGVPSAVFQE